MRRILILGFLVLLLPLATMAAPPTSIPVLSSVCCDVDADCAAILHCITGRHPACGGANSGCGRCNCVND
jgi:hypothetical protein